MPLCGGETRRCPPRNRRSKCWAHQSAIQILFTTIWRRRAQKHAELHERIPHVEDTQACWLLLLMCAATRAKFWLRIIRPEDTQAFAWRHDPHVWECLRVILGTTTALVSAKVLAHLPLFMEGLGFTSAVQTRVAAHWASWADSISMVRKRHPTVANGMIAGIDRDPVPHFQSVRNCEQVLVDCRSGNPIVDRNGCNTTHSCSGSRGKWTQLWQATEGFEATSREVSSRCGVDFPLRP